MSTAFSDVMKYFKEISAIPHPSGHTEGVQEYLVSFAKEHSLKYSRDKVGNVVIYKDGDASREPLVLQAHMDMVAVSTDGNKDLTKEGLVLEEKAGFLSAVGTSLGADDGIGCAYILALLSDDTLSTPPLEALFTVDEETGMDGAIGFDMALLKGKRLINLDSEDEGEILSSSAGGAHFASEYELSETKFKRSRIDIAVENLTGGHSGSEIHKRGANAIVVLCSVLKELSYKFGISLYSISGGEALNIIPKSASATIYVKNKDQVLSAIKALEEEYREEYKQSDPNLRISAVSGIDEETVQSATDDSTFKALSYITGYPNGVIEMNAEVPSVVMTSLNLGKIQAEIGKNLNRLMFIFSIRSNSDEKKTEFLKTLEEKALSQNVHYVIDAIYPSWKYKPSPLRDKMKLIYSDMYKKPMKEVIIHAGLECGYFLKKDPSLDAVSIGPDLSGVHTTEEKLNLASAERVFDYLKRVVQEV